MPDHNIIFPPSLKKGDCIGITCPAGYMPLERMEDCIHTLQEWGFRVRLGNTAGHQFHYFSGTDEERLADLQSMLDDPEIKAILFGRGGYGVSRIIDAIDFRKFRKHPKWLIGFSDITLLHAHINRRYRIATLHAPMAAAFLDGGSKDEYVGSLRKAILGRKGRYTCVSHVLNRYGRANGELTGGNLAMLAHICGTPSALQTRGKLLFIEDTGEYLYNVDRMMLQLKRSGMLEGLAGLIVGGFDSMKDTTIPFGKSVAEIVFDAVKDAEFPVCFGFPAGHEKENVALKIGGWYELKTGRRQTVLREV